MSKLADNVYAALKKVFPHNVIIKEHYVSFKGVRLFFDFYIKDLGVLIEAQGRQHEEFVQHFHVDRDGFMASKKRDRLKHEYCAKEDLVLVSFDDDDVLSESNLLNKVWGKMIS
jgi:hypothetical protein